MPVQNLVDLLGEGRVMVGGGLLIGVLFGYFAQRSRFCLRAAVIEFWHHKYGDKLSVWLLAFSSATVGVQVLILAGVLDVSSARQLATRGSVSGAAVGGILFGMGMVMARGCASRLLILSANGNLRALLSGLVFAVAAQASLSGSLAPLRLEISGWWTVEGGTARDLLAVTGVGRWGGLAFGVVWLIAAVVFAARSSLQTGVWLGGIGTGLMVAAAWWFTYAVSAQSFQVIAVQGLTFSGPSAEWLMRVLTQPAPAAGFDAGMLPAVFAGSLAGAIVGRDWKLEGFKDGYSMRRYIAGAILMGFGSMLAGGCAVGAGVTGGATFSLTSWITLSGMWLGAGITDKILDGTANGAHRRVYPHAPMAAP